MDINPYLILISGEDSEDSWTSKKRGKKSTTEDIFEDEEETSFWH